MSSFSSIVLPLLSVVDRLGVHPIVSRSKYARAQMGVQTLAKRYQEHPKKA